MSKSENKKDNNNQLEIDFDSVDNERSFFQDLDIETELKKHMNEESNIVYFFGYGLFLEKERLALEPLKNEKLIGSAFLPYYKLDFDRYATIEKSSNKKDSVWGLLYQIDKRTLEMLDTIEGYPTYYTRFKTSVYTTKGAYDQTWVYKMNPKPIIYSSKKEKPDINYYNLILNKAQELKFPNEYIKHIIKTVINMKD